DGQTSSEDDSDESSISPRKTIAVSLRPQMYTNRVSTRETLY
ncbi:hypothetical protein CDAR_165751, partial [Caerostris darwini]